MRTFAPVLLGITVSFLKAGASKCQLAVHAGIHYVAVIGARWLCHPASIFPGSAPASRLRWPTITIR